MPNWTEYKIRSYEENYWRYVNMEGYYVDDKRQAKKPDNGIPSEGKLPRVKSGFYGYSPQYEKHQDALADTIEFDIALRSVGKEYLWEYFAYYICGMPAEEIAWMTWQTTEAVNEKAAIGRQKLVDDLFKRN